jgi:hypothetical protein
VEKPHISKARKARQVKRNLKRIIVTFLDFKRIVRKEFVPTSQIVNSGFYCEVLRRLRKKLKDIVPNFDEKRFGWYIMITHRLTLPSSPTSFWRKTKLLLYPTHSTSLIWHPLTSYFLK